ncbi:MAG: PIN domain-containing protein [Candidatus Brockarchaeota archaeon]|nr:PIN domain-containing protein [Candidatus Brockarchaeota archaeon]MBO3842294.1 PIN domain-containing protein [Candidatus Brockarchaeota archaeon]
MREVVDTRFLIEHFYSDDPDVKAKTSKRLKELTQYSKGIIPTLVLGEIIKITCERRGKEEANLRYLSILRSGLHIEELTPDVARDAGLLKCRYRDIPMSDCIIASIAVKKRAKVLSDDPHFDVMKEIKRIWI